MTNRDPKSPGSTPNVVVRFFAGIWKFLRSFPKTHHEQPRDHGPEYEGTLTLGNGGIIIFDEIREHGIVYYVGQQYTKDGLYLGATPKYPQIRTNGGTYVSGGTPPSIEEMRKKAGLPPRPAA